MGMGRGFISQENDVQSLGRQLWKRGGNLVGQKGGEGRLLNELAAADNTLKSQP